MDLIDPSKIIDYIIPFVLFFVWIGGRVFSRKQKYEEPSENSEDVRQVKETIARKIQERQGTHKKLSQSVLVLKEKKSEEDRVPGQMFYRDSQIEERLQKLEAQVRETRKIQENYAKGHESMQASQKTLCEKHRNIILAHELMSRPLSLRENDLYFYSLFK